MTMPYQTVVHASSKLLKWNIGHSLMPQMLFSSTIHATISLTFHTFNKQNGNNYSKIMAFVNSCAPHNIQTNYLQIIGRRHEYIAHIHIIILVSGLQWILTGLNLLKMQQFVRGDNVINCGPVYSEKQKCTIYEHLNLFDTQCI